MNENKKVYVLLEAEGTGYGSPKDVMGVVYEKDNALSWVAKNAEYRSYRETRFLE